MNKWRFIESEDTGVRYVMADGPAGMDEPPMGKGGTSYYLDGEDPRTGKDPRAEDKKTKKRPR